MFNICLTRLKTLIILASYGVIVGFFLFIIIWPKDLTLLFIFNSSGVWFGDVIYASAINRKDSSLS
ncbi:MAG: hypothetical protein QXR82_05735 [Candidatus Bathyarchaeia archaeon]|nr:hypothetical protein [Candidatus Bathyarchaeota archaeon]